MAVKPDEELMLAADPIEDVAAGTEEELKTYDGDILHALLAAANYQQSEDETYTMRVVRKKVVLFTFRVCPLSEEQYDRCREKNTKYVRNKRIGVKVPESTNSVRYRSQLIYEATIPEDRAKIWDNKQMWEKLNAASGIDAIDKILMSGEKDKILEQIDAISGFDNNELEETTKN
jgi:hypothetical protein|nr:MAG TPA: tail assembly chaperone protein [Caudoviricetes sp.]